MSSMDALSESAEMMIKNINELASNGDRVRTSDLSAKTELKPASVTEMIQRLGEIGLVDYEPYHGVHLTKQGQHVADVIDHRLSEEQYEAVCNATKIVSQRSVMGANLTNFKAKHIYTINGNDIKETFVKWDKEKNKCFAGFTVTGSNVGVNETITVSGEVLSFFNTGIDTRVYFIKNF